MKGDVVTDSDGTEWTCTVGGWPGAFIIAGATAGRTLLLTQNVVPAASANFNLSNVFSADYRRYAIEYHGFYGTADAAVTASFLNAADSVVSTSRQWVIHHSGTTVTAVDGATGATFTPAYGASPWFANSEPVDMVIDVFDPVTAYASGKEYIAMWKCSYGSTNTGPPIAHQVLGTVYRGDTASIRGLRLITGSGTWTAGVARVYGLI